MVLLQPKPEKLFGEVNWSVLIFFSGLFVIVGGVEASGLLNMLGEELAAFAGGGPPTLHVMTAEDIRELAHAYGAARPSSNNVDMKL